MLERTKKTIRQAFTENDNETADLFRITFFLGFVSFIGLEAWNVIKSGAFDATAFGTGFATLFGSGATGVGVKSKLEGPAQEQKPGEGT